jgi:hypothetical protein
MTTMGSATWSSTVPAQTILLHINDPAECQALYGGGVNTCFIVPDAPTAARVTHFRAGHHGGLLVVTWRLTTRAGVVGFNVFDRTHTVNARLIPVHAARAYRYERRWSGRGPYSIRLVLASA